MKREYTYIPKTKKKLKFSIETVSYMKKKRLPKKTHEEKLYERAKEIKTGFLTDKKLAAFKMCSLRTSYIFDSEEFKELISIGAAIRKKEVLDYLCFALCTAISAGIATLISFLIGIPIFYLCVIPLVALFFIIFKPKIKFRQLFNNVYLPICYVCANIIDQSEGMEFLIEDKKQNWDRKNVNKTIVTNRFKIVTKHFKTLIEKMIARNYITTYRMRRGQIEVGKKLATIFSGYSFNLNYNELKGDATVDDTLQIAIINENTFVGTDGLFSDDASTLKSIPLKTSLLGDDWKIYVRDGVELSDKKIREIQKKTLMIKNEIGIFNAYLTPNTIRMMLNVQLSRNGLQEEFFQAQLKNPESLSYNGFFSIVKTLYIINCMHRLSKIIYERVERGNRETNENKRNISANRNRFIRNLSDAKDKEKNAFSNQQRESNKNILANKSGEASMSTAIKVIITVILSSLVLLGFFLLINDVYVPGAVNNYSEVFSENSTSDIVRASELM